jgi:hypothetical protein
LRVAAGAGQNGGGTGLRMDHFGGSFEGRTSFGGTVWKVAAGTGQDGGGTGSEWTSFEELCWKVAAGTGQGMGEGLVSE